jgi:DNA repair protein RadC
MATEENLHKGHRNRMFERFLKNSDSIQDHELLELILFGVLPRIDTNPIAHRLLNFFGSLDAVFSASPKALASVGGVGEKCAAHLFAMGKVVNRVLESRQFKKNYKFDSFDKIKNKVIDDFEGVFEELFKIYLLDDKFNLLTTLVFSNKKMFSVEIDPRVLANVIAIHKPKQLIIAHNHPSGQVLPSKEDDYASKKAQVLCSLHGVTLLDHVIVSGKKAYSYYRENRLEVIKQQTNLEAILNQGDSLNE